MRQITVGNYVVDIFVEQAYSPNDSVQTYDYDYTETGGYRCNSIIGIKVHQLNALLKSAVVGASGGGTAVHDTSFVCDCDRLVVCCSDSIFCLSLPRLTLLWKTKADSATCFEIFDYKGDYIVHGELEISRLSNSGGVIWQQSGADIFTTLNSSAKDFVITDDYILATDWEKRKYKFDFDGNSITQ